MRFVMLPKKCSNVDIILDARMIGHSGIGTYLRGLLEEYSRQDFFKEQTLALALTPGLFSELNGAYPRFPFYSPIYSVREQMEYLFHLRRCRLWHAPHYNVPVLKKGVRLVVTVHDLIHWIFRREFYSSLQAAYARFFFQRVVHLADQIIAVSEQTRWDLIRYFKASPDQVRVIYEGVSEDFFQPHSPDARNELLEKYHLPKRFFLYVGLIKPHKNLSLLLKVFNALRSKKKLEMDLVVVGKKDKKYPKGYEWLAGIKTGEGVYYIPAIPSRRDLACLYASAFSLVHPSLYEGFGLTCLEAMASGTPVIVSKAGPLPEVVGDAGLFIDPSSESSLAEALLEMSANESLRRDLIERGRLRAREFSWSQAARQTVDLYRELLD